MQLTPFPSNPLLHVHTKPPTTSAQVAFTWQLSTPSSHSSMSACRDGFHEDICMCLLNLSLYNKVLSWGTFTPFQRNNTNFLLVQFTPSPSNPLLHVQIKLPITSAHVPFTWQLSISSSHSSTSMCRVEISHMYALNKIVYYEIINASGGQLPPFARTQSNFLLMQLTPSPSNPLLHVHTKLPITSTQVAFTWQLSISSSHSSTSMCRVEISHMHAMNKIVYL